ncbi:MAG: DUF3467 domain-containing protein [Rikenellaceae bacterium]|nr:DUF3467 domain-containing protein [Rikenellaceae bacterium]MDE7356662.1 DUF3467 domain-containing protein [Rikenellaceae bacterium]
MKYTMMSDEVNIEIDDTVIDGTYSNLAIISHSSSEFVLDFICLMPAAEKGHVKSRIILAPEHAKRLMFSLKENISRYEKSFGEINIHPSDEEMKLGVTTLGEA